jgi:hypothetical protein
MNATVYLKAAFLVAWLALVAAMAMVFTVSDQYPGGYEAMLEHALLLFAGGAVLAFSGLFAALVWHRGKLSGAWFAAGTLQLYASAVIFLVTIAAMFQ